MLKKTNAFCFLKILDSLFFSSLSKTWWLVCNHAIGLFEIYGRRKGSPHRARFKTSVDAAPGSMWPQGVHLVQAAEPTPRGCPHCGHIGRMSCVSHMSSSSHSTNCQSERPFRQRSSMNTVFGWSSKTIPKAACAHGDQDFMTARRPLTVMRRPKRSQPATSKRMFGLDIHASTGAAAFVIVPPVATALSCIAVVCLFDLMAI